MKNYICLRCGGIWKYNSETRERTLVAQQGLYMGMTITYTISLEWVSGSEYCPHCASIEIKEIE